MRHLSRQWNCWSLRCSWSITCGCCSNYIFILDLPPAFNGLGKEKCKTKRETFKFVGFGATYTRDLMVVIFATSWFYSCPSELLQWNYGNHMNDPMPLKVYWRIWVNHSNETAKHYDMHKSNVHINGLVQKRHNSSALAMELVFLALTHRYLIGYTVKVLYFEIDWNWLNPKYTMQYPLSLPHHKVLI